MARCVRRKKKAATWVMDGGVPYTGSSGGEEGRRECPLACSKGCEVCKQAGATGLRTTGSVDGEARTPSIDRRLVRSQGQALHLAAEE